MDIIKQEVEDVKEEVGIDLNKFLDLNYLDEEKEKEAEKEKELEAEKEKAKGKRRLSGCQEGSSR